MVMMVWSISNCGSARVRSRCRARSRRIRAETSGAVSACGPSGPRPWRVPYPGYTAGTSGLSTAAPVRRDEPAFSGWRGGDTIACGVLTQQKKAAMEPFDRLLLDPTQKQLTAVLEQARRHS